MADRIVSEELLRLMTSVDWPEYQRAAAIAQQVERTPVAPEVAVSEEDAPKLQEVVEG